MKQRYNLHTGLTLELILHEPNQMATTDEIYIAKNSNLQNTKLESTTTMHRSGAFILQYRQVYCKNSTVSTYSTVNFIKIVSLYYTHFFSFFF